MDQVQKYDVERPAGQEHIPLYPKGFIAIRILQLVLGVAALGLNAYLLATYIPYAGDCLMIFTAVVNLIITIYYIVAAFGPKTIYNYWAVLALDIFLVIFWLCSFAVLASEAAYVFDLVNEETTYCDYYSSYCDYYGYDASAITVYGSCMAGAAGVGALEFVLYIVSLAIHGVALHRHRAAGLHCTPGGNSGIAPVVAAESDMTSSVNPVYHPVPQAVVPGGIPQYMQQNSAYSQQTMTPPPQQHPYGVPQQQPTMAQPTPSHPPQAPSPIPVQLTGSPYVQTHQLSATPSMQPQGPYSPPQ